MIDQVSSRSASSEQPNKLVAAVVVAASVVLCAIQPTLAQPAAGSYEAPAQSGAPTAPDNAGEQIFYITTVHVDGKTSAKGDANHPPEPFPSSAASAGGGLIVRPPDEQGAWSVRAFVFQPSQVVVRQGDTVVLNFVGVQGPSHTIAIDGRNERISLQRGEMKSVRFIAEQPGTIRFVSVGREPTMQGSILVLRRE